MTASGSTGQVYVPKYKKCIAITNQEAPVGPYWTILRPCGATGPSFAQKWDLRTVQNDQMYWVCVLFCFLLLLIRISALVRPLR
jgi:hypothetical protein